MYTTNSSTIFYPDSYYSHRLLMLDLKSAKLGDIVRFDSGNEWEKVDYSDKAWKVI